MGGGAAGGLWRHQQWSPSWILPRIWNQVESARNGYRNFLCFTWISTMHDFSLKIYFYFYPQLAWPPATCDVISHNHSNWPSLNLSLNLREGWTNSYWKRQAPVVQKLDSAIHQINYYPVDKNWGNQLHYPGFEQLGPGANVLSSRKKLRKTLWGRCTSEGKKIYILKTEDGEKYCIQGTTR